MYSWLEEAIAGGAEIVTVNNRLARELRHACDHAQLARGLRSWPTPRIMPWTVWLGSLLDRCDASLHLPLRIHPQATAILWEHLLIEHAGERLLSPDNLVRQAQQTWQRVQDWNVPVGDLARYAGSDDERLFATIARGFERILDEHSWIDGARLPRLVTDMLERDRLDAPARIACAGFDRVTPAAAKLFRALAGRGAAVSVAPGGQRNVTVRVASCADRAAELRTAGLWARRLLENNPAARVAVVSPGLERDAPRSARLVREGLVPGWQYAGASHAAALNVSYGRRLSEYPLIGVALLWLSWACRGLPSRDVSILLRAPFAGNAKTDGRFRLETALRRLPDRNWRPASLAAALRDGNRSPEAADWLQRVELLASLEAAWGEAESPSVWASRIDQVLQKLGWPGEAALDTSEYQLVNRWRELLNEFSRLDVVLPRVDLAGIVSRLATFAAGTVFQPEGEPGMVQLLGTLEAAGLEFDHVWVCHLDAEQWPPPAHPLPLISRALQRRLEMPDASPPETLEFARRVLERLVRSGTDVVLSWPAAQQDLELEASPLLSPYAGESSAPVEDPGWFAAKLRCDGAVVPVPDDPAPPVRPGEKVSGGSATVQRQVTDPFSAFAYGRLHVRELPAIESGLPASTRGRIVHRALHRLLRDRPTSREIASWGDEAGDRIERAVDVALARPAMFADGVLLRLLAIERRRLRAMLRKFLAAETAREAFAIESVEESIRYSRHGVTLDLRADRIDRLADGTLLIVDYKTGAVKTLLTKDGVPRELQLVVYAAAMPGAVGGIVLINVDSREMVYRGAGGSVEWDRSPPELWQERLRGWQETVDTALASLAAGDVRANTGLSVAEGRPLSVLSRIEELKRGG